jgi:hypothetical protein
VAHAAAEFSAALDSAAIFRAWRDDAIWQRINHQLLMVAREVSPPAGVIDSQSVKITESGGIPNQASQLVTRVDAPP